VKGKEEKPLESSKPGILESYLHTKGGSIVNASPNIFEVFYRTFRDISRSVHSSTKVTEVLSLVVRKSAEILQAKGALVRILNLHTHEMELFAAHGLSERYLSKGHVSSETIITDLCRLNKVILIRDIYGNPRIQYPREFSEEGFRMALDIPLLLKEDVVGIIRVFFDQLRDFSEQELDFLTAVAEQSALALDKARIIEAQESRYNHLVIQTEKLTALGRMAAGIAHEINNPMGGILVYSTMLLDQVSEQDPVREGLEIIVHETLRCKRIIQELLDFSRERPPLKKISDLNLVMGKALSILDNEFRLRYIGLEKDLSPDLPKVFLDTNQIQQVFMNILINAIEASQERDRIRVSTRLGPTGETVIADIIDHGSGIFSENLSKIFEPFFSTKEKGTGLGLSVSFGIIQNHQGRIDVSSLPGSGTRFSIILPVHSSETKPPSEDHQDASP
jgi:two-component system, NtrC family, sensor kinase